MDLDVARFNLASDGEASSSKEIQSPSKARAAPPGAPGAHACVRLTHAVWLARAGGVQEAAGRELAGQRRKGGEDPGLQVQGA